MGQDTAPIGTDFKTLPTYSLKYYTADSTLWVYKGTTYGWTKVPRPVNSYWYQITDIIGTDTTFVKVENKDTVNFFLYKLKSDSVTNPGYFTNYKGSLKEDLSNKVTSLSGSSTDVQYPSAKLAYDQLALKANIDNPTFTTKITTPGLNIPTGATLNYFWQCTNAATGAGAWTAVSATQYNRGGWDANTNTPTLANGTGTNGWYYTCTVAGTTNFGAGNITFATGDQVMYDGSIWYRIPVSIAVNLTGPITSVGNATSIASQTGTGTTFAMSAGPSFTGNVTISGMLGIGSTSPTKALSFGNNADRRIFVEPTATDIGGKYLNVESGSTVTGTSTPDVNGGILYLRAGVGTGTGKSRIYFQTGTKLTTGTTLQTVATKMSLTEEGYLGLGNTSPTAKLHIDNSSYWNTSTAPSFLIQSLRPDILLYDDNSTSGAEVRSIVNNSGVLSIGRAEYTSDDYGYNERVIDLSIAADGTVTATGIIAAYGGNSTQWNDAYDHALIAAGTGVHISDAERTAWNAKQAAITFGIANTNAVKIDMTGVADNDYAKFTATGLEGRSYAEVLSDIGAAATNQSFYIGTTAVAINRASAGLTLAGITLTSPVLGTPASGTLTNCTNAHWDAAYNHSLISGGTGVHISDGERISWNAKQSATLSNGKILVGNASNVATAVTMTGDVTINNAGVSAIGAGKVTNTMVATAIDAVKLANGTVTNSELQYINSVTSDVQTQLNGKQAQLNGTGFVKASGTSISYVTDNSTNWNAAYNHSVDNTQAHSDYLLNNTNDITSGTLTAVNFILSSDRRLKENISYIKNLHKFEDIKFVQFNLKSDPNQLRFGAIAQDVEKIAPELVYTDEKEFKSIGYTDLFAAKICLLELKIMELEKANKRQVKRDYWFYKHCKKSKITELENRIIELEKRLK